ncbi:MAG TPA: hypothetical protein VKK31_06410 [Thermoanaerobaculia bacterium]|nr:hypothetical protein [Thermoanaerobaculia bacterium]
MLSLLLAAALGGALTLDRRSWPGLVGDEATYLMQAQSLAWDHDLRYSRRDYDRFAEQWSTRPEGLILRSGDGGKTLTYGKPASYAAWIAPFLRLSPTRGAAIANALLLALAAVMAARTLERRLGPAAPLWAAVWIFASVAFAYTFWAHSDLFLMSLSALALALAYGARPEESSLRVVLRWLAVGALLYLVTASRPFYGILLVAAALAVPPAQRKLGLPAIVLAAGLLLGVSGFANLAEGDSWTPYGGERQSFDSSTGFPEVELPADSWQEQIAVRGSRSWRAADEFEPRQSAWNVLYFLIGRHVGILPYFLPLFLGLVAFRRGEGRGTLIVAVAVAAACFLVTRPFNFYGGGGAIADRYFLPLYPALWFTAARPARARWAVIAAVMATVLAAPFLWPLWAQPRAYLLDEEGGYRYVSGFARQLLPYETTQSHLKPSGREDFVHDGLWVKPLTTSVRAEGDGATRILLGPSGSGQILLGSPQPIDGVRLTLLPPAPERLEVSGAETVSTLPEPRGGSVRLLHFQRPRAVHRMWWTRDLIYLYQVELEGTGGFSFQLHPLLSSAPQADIYH